MSFYAYHFASNGNLRKAMLGGAGNGMEMANIDTSGWNYKVGGKSHHEQMAVVMNLRKIVGDDTDGLFGLPFMQGERVEFNYVGAICVSLPMTKRLPVTMCALIANGSATRRSV